MLIFIGQEKIMKLVQKRNKKEDDRTVFFKFNNIQFRKRMKCIWNNLKGGKGTKNRLETCCEIIPKWQTMYFMKGPLLFSFLPR